MHNRLILLSIGRCEVLGTELHEAFRRPGRRGGARAQDDAQAQVSNSYHHSVGISLIAC